MLVWSKLGPSVHRRFDNFIPILFLKTESTHGWLMVPRVGVGGKLLSGGGGQPEYLEYWQYFGSTWSTGSISEVHTASAGSIYGSITKHYSYSEHSEYFRCLLWGYRLSLGVLCLSRSQYSQYLDRRYCNTPSTRSIWAAGIAILPSTRSIWAAGIGNTPSTYSQYFGRQSNTAILSVHTRSTKCARYSECSAYAPSTYELCSGSICSPLSVNVRYFLVSMWIPKQS